MALRLEPAELDRVALGEVRQAALFVALRSLAVGVAALLVAARKPRKVITVPEAPNSTFSPSLEAAAAEPPTPGDETATPSASPGLEAAAIRSETVCPWASFIWDAIVRIQISS